MLFLVAKVSGRTMRWPLSRRELLIGRGQDCDLVVCDPTVSRRHFALTHDGEDIKIRDLESRHGLWLDGRQVEEQSIAPGAWFFAGAVPMAVREGVTLTGCSVEDASEVDGNGNGIDPIAQNRDTAAEQGDDAQDAEQAESNLLASRLTELYKGEHTQPRRDGILYGLLSLFAGIYGLLGTALIVGTKERPRVRALWGIEPSAGWPEPTDAEADQEGAVLDAGQTSVLSIAIEVGDERCRLLAHPWNAADILEPGTELIAALIGHELHLEQCEAVEESTLSDQASAIADGGCEEPVFVAVSQVCETMLRQVDRLAQTNLPVLVVGSSGTGKEILARRLHARSDRRDGPFVAINCAALPAELLESELFGIKRGVATGVDERIGHFAEAHGGTLFLDEIGDMPLALQPKLLRALESRQIVPLGASHPESIDVRVIAATHREIQEEVNQGRFRRDLLYRIAGATVQVPPLERRPEDIMPLARHFAQEAAREHGRSFKGIDLDAARLLLGYAWPGNARELRNAMTRAVALAETPIIDASLLPPEIQAANDTLRAETLLALRKDWRTARERFDRYYFANLLTRCKGNLSEAARLAGLARSNLYRHLTDLNLRK